jgi:hypothetical protein
MTSAHRDAAERELDQAPGSRIGEVAGSRPGELAIAHGLLALVDELAGVRLALERRPHAREGVPRVVDLRLLHLPDDVRLLIQCVNHALDSVGTGFGGDAAPALYRIRGVLEGWLT